MTYRIAFLTLAILVFGAGRTRSSCARAATAWPATASWARVRLAVPRSASSSRSSRRAGSRACCGPSPAAACASSCARSRRTRDFRVLFARLRPPGARHLGRARRRAVRRGVPARLEGAHHGAVRRAGGARDPARARVAALRGATRQGDRVSAGPRSASSSAPLVMAHRRPRADRCRARRASRLPGSGTPACSCSRSRCCPTRSRPTRCAPVDYARAPSPGCGPRGRRSGSPSVQRSSPLVLAIGGFVSSTSGVRPSSPVGDDGDRDRLRRRPGAADAREPARPAPLPADRGGAARASAPSR